jgi:glycopeptide antibiotics resistance protein
MIHHEIKHPIPFVLGTYIVISASFARQLFSLLGVHASAATLTALVATVLITLYYHSFFNRGFKVVPLLGSALVIGVICVLIVKAKFSFDKFHFIEYSLLGFFAARAAGLRWYCALPVAIVFVMAVTFNDEFFQSLLPYRTFDLRDILSNLIGGSAGAILYLLQKKKI